MKLSIAVMDVVAKSEANNSLQFPFGGRSTGKLCFACGAWLALRGTSSSSKLKRIV